MCRPKANPLNAAMIEELLAAVREAASDDAVRALVLASDLPRFFSAGFDFREVFQYTREQMTSFFARFISLYENLYRLPKPVVAALNGHTFAGGAILAVCCDFRVMAEGDAGFALNEINLGLVVTSGLLQIVAGAVGPAQSRALLLTGESIGAARAFATGLVHELAPAGLVRERALAIAEVLAAKPPQAYAETKRALRAAAGYDDSQSDLEHLEAFIERWFSSEAAQARQALVSKLA